MKIWNRLYVHFPYDPVTFPVQVDGNQQETNWKLKGNLRDQPNEIPVRFPVSDGNLSSLTGRDGNRSRQRYLERTGTGIGEFHGTGREYLLRNLNETGRESSRPVPLSRKIPYPSEAREKMKKRNVIQIAV